MLDSPRLFNLLHYHLCRRRFSDGIDTDRYLWTSYSWLIHWIHWVLFKKLNAESLQLRSRHQWTQLFHPTVSPLYSIHISRCSRGGLSRGLCEIASQWRCCEMEGYFDGPIHRRTCLQPPTWLQLADCLAPGSARTCIPPSRWGFCAP